MLLSLESLNVVGAFVFQLAGAIRWSHRWSETHRPAGVPEHEQTGIGVPQKLGSPVNSTEEDPAGDTGRPTPGSLRPHAGAMGANKCVVPWYRHAKETKCGEKGDRCRSALIVPKKLGNKRPCGPSGGKRGIESMELLLGDTTNA